MSRPCHTEETARLPSEWKRLVGFLRPANSILHQPPWARRTPLTAALCLRPLLSAHEAVTPGTIRADLPEFLSLQCLKHSAAFLSSSENFAAYAEVEFWDLEVQRSTSFTKSESAVAIQFSETVM